MNFTAIDFETANHHPTSACAMGIVVVKDGKIFARASWLMRPKPFYFIPAFIDIHGIRPEDVKDAPEFHELWPEIKSFIHGQVIIAHNASFDIRVLRNVLIEYQLAPPSFNYACTVQLARKTWPHLSNHKLNNLAEHLDITFTHHDASEDAYACAMVAIQAGKARGAVTFLEMIKPKEF